MSKVQLRMLAYVMLGVALATVTDTAVYALPTPLHAYEFNGNLLDSGTGNVPITSEQAVATFSGGNYTFDPKRPNQGGDANDGLTLYNGGLSNPGIYSVEMYLTYDSVLNISDTRPQHWLKLVDFKNAVPSLGMYYEDLAFSTRFDANPAPAGVSSIIKHAYGDPNAQPFVASSPTPVMFGGDWLHIVTTRDAANTVRTYVNGGEVYSFVDGVLGLGDESDAVFSGATNPTGIMRFLQTDVGASGGGWYEVGKGAIDFLRIYDSALSASDVATLASAVPEPATMWLLAVAGLFGLNLRRNRMS